MNTASFLPFVWGLALNGDYTLGDFRLKSQPDQTMRGKARLTKGRRHRSQKERSNRRHASR